MTDSSHPLPPTKTSNSDLSQTSPVSEPSRVTPLVSSASVSFPPAYSFSPTTLGAYSASSPFRSNGSVISIAEHDDRVWALDLTDEGTLVSGGADSRIRDITVEIKEEGRRIE